MPQAIRRGLACQSQARRTSFRSVASAARPRPLELRGGVERVGLRRLVREGEPPLLPRVGRGEVVERRERLRLGVGPAQRRVERGRRLLRARAAAACAASRAEPVSSLWPSSRGATGSRAPASASTLAARPREVGLGGRRGRERERVAGRTAKLRSGNRWRLGRTLAHHGGDGCRVVRPGKGAPKRVRARVGAPTRPRPCPPATKPSLRRSKTGVRSCVVSPGSTPPAASVAAGRSAPRRSPCHPTSHPTTRPELDAIDLRHDQTQRRDDSAAPRRESLALRIPAGRRAPSRGRSWRIRQSR
jgi:hypothetical protein